MKIKIGKVTHFYRKIGVAVVELSWLLCDGDMITITKRNGRTNFTQRVRSMEINHKRIHGASCGDTIGLKVKQRVRVKDSVYKEVNIGERAIIADAFVGEELSGDADITLRAIRKHVEKFPSFDYPSFDYDSISVWFEKLKKLVGK